MKEQSSFSIKSTYSTHSLMLKYGFRLTFRYRYTSAISSHSISIYSEHISQPVQAGTVLRQRILLLDIASFCIASILFLVGNFNIRLLFSGKYVRFEPWACSLQSFQESTFTFPSVVMRTYIFNFYPCHSDHNNRNSEYMLWKEGGKISCPRPLYCLALSSGYAARHVFNHPT